MRKVTFMTAVSAAALIICGAIPAKAQQMDYGSLESLFGEPVTTSATGKPQVHPRHLLIWRLSLPKIFAALARGQSLRH